MIVLVGCSEFLSPIEKLETIFASKENCITPCWQGITPAQSTESDFLTLIDSLPHNKFEDVRRSDLIPQGTRYIWYDQTNSLAGSLEISDGIIIFIGFQSRDELTLGAIIEYLGPPNAYTARVSTGEAYVFNLYMYYENKGVVVNVRSIPFDALPTAFQPTCEVSLTDDMLVRQIYLIEPGSTDEIMSSLSRELIVLEESKSWAGLGTVKLTSCPK